MKKLRVAVCLLLLGLLIPAILQLRGRVPMDTQALIEKKYGGWAGVLRLWVYEGWKPGAGSGAAWLNRCIASFEKGHPGVYVQPEYVDGATMAAMGRDGLLSPDMVLFPPGGLESPSALVALDGEDLYAAPVMLGGYMWAYNAALLESIPRSWRDAEVSPAVLPDEDGRRWSVALLALCSGKYRAEGIIEDVALSDDMDLGLEMEETLPEPTAVPEDGPLRCLLPGGFAASVEAWRDFINGDAAAMPVTQREVRRLQALSDQGKGVDWKLGVSGNVFTDQVLYIGVVRQTEDEKTELCRAFAGHLQSDGCQGELYRIGAFSATGASSGYAGGDPLAAMEAMLRKGGVCAPGAFDGEWAEDVAPIVREFLGGDPDPAALWGLASGRIRQKSEQ